jgi:Sec-independent protein secretion pathway component TatC
MSPVDILMSHEMAYLALALTAVMLLVGRVRVTKTSLINETSAWQWFGTVIVLVLGIVGAFIVGAIFTPPDVLSQFICGPPCPKTTLILLSLPETAPYLTSHFL